MEILKNVVKTVAGMSLGIGIGVGIGIVAWGSGVTFAANTISHSEEDKKKEILDSAKKFDEWPDEVF